MPLSCSECLLQFKSEASAFHHRKTVCPDGKIIKDISKELLALRKRLVKVISPEVQEESKRYKRYDHTAIINTSELVQDEGQMKDVLYTGTESKVEVVETEL